MKSGGTCAVVALILLLFASIGLLAFAAVERERREDLLEDAIQQGYIAREQPGPGCGWVRVPRCERCNRFHASPAASPCTPSLILPGPIPEVSAADLPPMVEIFPTPAPEHRPEPRFPDTEFVP